MSGRLDFAALYRELGLMPGCSSTQLRAAYRRRVSRLHPDQGGDAQDTGRLQWLNRLYRAALDFERDHGRLPGAEVAACNATPKRSVPERSVPDRLEARRPGPVAPQEFDDADATSGLEWPASASASSRIPRFVLSVAVVGVCVLLWRVVAGFVPDHSVAAERGAAFPAYTEGSASSRSSGQYAGHGSAIEPGIGKDQVLAIQGEPLDRHPVRWLYGPSWVEFACDRVVGWYSSPLQPLRVRAQAPARDANGPAGDCEP